MIMSHKNVTVGLRSFCLYQKPVTEERLPDYRRLETSGFRIHTANETNLKEQRRWGERAPLVDEDDVMQLRQAQEEVDRDVDMFKFFQMAGIDIFDVLREELMDEPIFPLSDDAIKTMKMNPAPDTQGDVGFWSDE